MNSPSEDPLRKTLQVFGNSVTECWIENPTEKRVTRLLRSLDASRFFGFVAILDQQDGSYTQFAAEAPGYHVEWREIGEPFHHWWAIDNETGDEWLTVEVAVEIFTHFLDSHPKPAHYMWRNLDHLSVG